jgi:hypothetical protein
VTFVGLLLALVAMQYDPAPRQREFHALTTTEALFGGSAGPGKSIALTCDPFEQIIVEHERCKAREIQWGQSTGMAIHFRREMPRLEETIFRAKILFGKLDPAFKFRDNDHAGQFSSGYRFRFAHLKDSDSFLNYRSAQATHLAFDELIEFEADQYHELVGRCRSTDPVLKTMLKVRSASNPGANWVREYFVDPAPEGSVILKKRFRLRDGTEEIRTRLFLKARLYDNPDKEYVRQYEANLMDKPYHIRAALLDGNWYVVAGAFFADVWDVDRIVIKPFKIPAGWRKFRSADWGYKEECVILWWAVDPEGNMICYRELTLNGRKAKRRYDAREVAERIREIEIAAGEWNHNRGCSRLEGWMDTQLWEERGKAGSGQNITMADDMASVGVYWHKATKGRKQSAQQFIKRANEHGPNGEPGVMFFETCRGCIMTIPAIGTDAEDAEKPADGGPDHWWAAVAYALSANLLPTGNEYSNYPDDDPDEVASPPPSAWGRFGYGGS